jgi:hypothetical protein
MLSSDQIESFKADGHLILPSFVSCEQIQAWRDQFWGHLGCTIDEPEKWPEKVKDFKPDPIFGDLPELQSIAGQVGGGHFKGGGCGVAVRWPQTGEEWAMPESGHLDGYPGEGCQAVLLVGATTYLYDTEPGGGNYVYWPASHNLAHRYFRQYPDRIEGTFRETPEWDERGWGIFSDDGPEPAREFVARAGDVILWHGWLCHSGSSNLNKLPRVGFFARWTHDDDAMVREAIPADPWHHWEI